MSSLATIYALSSGSPPAAIAVIRISGTEAHSAAASLAGTLPEPRLASLRTLRSADGELIDEALVLRFDGPASVTGEDLVELHCHGGRAIVDAILSALRSIPGLREARPGEFTRRSFENGRIDLTEAEGLADLLEAETESQRKAALAVAGGGLRRQVESWRERVVTLSAMAEAAIDYVGDEDETAADEARIAAQAAELAAELDEWLAQPRSEALRQGIRVVFAGPPNAGKSSVLNALVQEDRAIVTEIPGTTRDVIEVPLAIGGIPFLLVDTAGLRESGDAVERIGVGLARQQLHAADILLWLGEPGDAPDHPAAIRIHPQADRPERAAAPEGSLAVSALNGTGLAELRRRLMQVAKTLLPSEGRIALNRRQAEALGDAADSLRLVSGADLVLTAEALRRARLAFDRVTGRSGIEDVLDSLFGRFCLGK